MTQHNTNNDNDDILHDNWQHGRFNRFSFPDSNKLPESCVVTCLQFDDDKLVVGVDNCSTIFVFDSKTGKLRSTLDGHEKGVWSLEYIGNTLVTGSADCSLRVWDMDRKVCTHVFRSHTSTVRRLKIVLPTLVNGVKQPSQPLIVTGNSDSTLRVWRLPNPKTDPPFFNDDDDNNGVVVNPWQMHVLISHGEPVRDIAVHGNTLISGGYDQAVHVWNLETGQLVHRMEGHSQRIYALAIDPVRNRCYSGAMGGSLRKWDYVIGRCRQRLEGHTILTGLVAVSTHHLVSASADSILRVWDLDTGTCQHVLEGGGRHNASITCFQHDEHKIIAGSEGGLKMWNIKTGTHIKDLMADNQVDGVWRVAFDKQRCIAAVYRDNVTSIEVFDFGVHGLEE